MNFMECQGCRHVVSLNNTGMCLSCQSGFTGVPKEDSYMLQKNHKEKLIDLLLEEKENENALQKPSPEKDDVCHKTKDGS